MDKQIPNDFTYLWSIKTAKRNKQNSNRLIDTEKGSGYQRVGVGESGRREKGHNNSQSQYRLVMGTIVQPGEYS